MEIIACVNKKKTEIVGEREGKIIVNIKGKAENNEANNEIVRFFSKKYGKNVKIVKGLRSRNKLLRFS